jgi:hypothetical protein
LTPPVSPAVRGVSLHPRGAVAPCSLKGPAAGNQVPSPDRMRTRPPEGGAPLVPLSLSDLLVRPDRGNRDTGVGHALGRRSPRVKELRDPDAGGGPSTTLSKSGSVRSAVRRGSSTHLGSLARPPHGSWRTVTNETTTETTSTGLQNAYHGSCRGTMRP